MLDRTNTVLGGTNKVLGEANGLLGKLMIIECDDQSQLDTF